jgi:TusA-related sulfurtransferase
LGDVGVVKGVGLDVNGKVVLGAGQTGVCGVICPSNVMAINDPIDVMTDGEIVDVALTAGTNYYANTTTGVLETGAPAAGANKTKVGWTVQAWRLIVRASQVQG